MSAGGGPIPPGASDRFHPVRVFFEAPGRLCLRLLGGSESASIDQGPWHVSSQGGSERMLVRVISLPGLTSEMQASQITEPRDRLSHRRAAADDQQIGAPARRFGTKRGGRGADLLRREYRTSRLHQPGCRASADEGGRRSLKSRQPWPAPSHAPAPTARRKPQARNARRSASKGNPNRRSQRAPRP